MTQEAFKENIGISSKIRSLIDIPIVLHGASDWEDGKAAKAIELGVNCFNVDTDTRMSFVNSLSMTFKEGNDPGFDIRTILGDARAAVVESVKHKIRLFGSDGKI